MCVCVFVCFNILCVRLENAYACPQNGGFTGKNWESRTFCSFIPQLYFVSAVVAVASSHMSSSSSASWTRFSPPSNFVNGHVSTVWFMACLWPQSQKGDWARPHLCKLARHGPWPVRKRFIRNHVRRGRSKPGCHLVGSVTIVWLTVTTEADNQSSFHCVIVSIDVVSDHIGRRDARRGLRWMLKDINTHRPIWMGFDDLKHVVSFCFTV